MAAGLGYKEFTTGDVLTAADANGYLASQVVMVFADSADRTADLTSPEEGMLSYLKDTNAVEKYDGAAWVSVGGGTDTNDIVRIASTPFTASGAVNLNDIFSTTYTNYIIILNITSASGTGNLQARLRVGGADNTTSVYSSQYDFNLTSGATSGTTKTSAQSYWQFSFISDAPLSIPFTISQPFQTAQTFASTENFMAGDGYKLDSAGWFNNTTSFTGMTFIASSGNITGEAIIYGMKRA